MQDALPLDIANLHSEVAAPQELESGVWRIPLPLPFGAYEVNLYLLRGSQASDGWLLIDCPLDTQRSEAIFRAALEQVGITVSDIKAIALTHGHPDHLGASGLWQRRSGAPVYLLKAVANVLPALWGNVENDAFIQAARALVAHGMPPDEAQTLVTRAVQLRRLLALPDQPVLLEADQRITRCLFPRDHPDGTAISHHARWLERL